MSEFTMIKENKKEEIIEKLNNVKKVVAKKADVAKEKISEARENTKEYVKKNPEKAIGIAAGIGAVIGATIALLSRRKK